jgi:transcriptional regulator with XRE-family HTH domain
MPGPPEQPHTTVGDRVRELRLRLGLTQADLAGDRYSAAYVSTIETGRRRASRHVLEYLAPRLGVEVGDLSSDQSAEWAVEMARDLRSEGRSRAARDLLERSLTNLERAGRVAPGVLVLLHRELARAAARRDLEEAEHHLRKAIDYAGREGASRSALAATYLELGDVQSSRGRHRAAMVAYRRSAQTMLALFGVPTNRELDPSRAADADTES